MISPVESESKTPTRETFLDDSHDDSGEKTLEIVPSPNETETTLQGLSAPPTPQPVGLTDDSDTDFQSAYSRSTSPRGSYVSVDKVDIDAAVLSDAPSTENIEDRLSAPPKTRRERVSSTSTAKEKSEPLPALSSSTVPIPVRVRVANIDKRA